MKHTITTLAKSKSVKKLTMVTAYDALFSNIFDGEVDCILVGDSLNMSFAGNDDTLSIGMQEMLYHTKAVCKGAPNTFVICDMPFGTYVNEATALKNAIMVYQKTKADAIKIEGGKDKSNIIEFLTSNSIAVVGHIGLLPQNVRADGGYKIQGKDEKSIKLLIEDAKAIEEAGACMIVIEGVKPEAAKAITESVNIPTIGIGAGKDTDGQVLVWSDMLGFLHGDYPKFVKKYMDGKSLVKESIKKYVQEVESGTFPSKEQEY
jgi:3-methyl-2-oxobutanoate hydroxymethyltransferase